ncbi:helix-turn-helix domain-containing protein [Sphingobacterium corticibacterium]|uniref:AraC family transcriptional regulator n=1 Tax=Sphingobacterium corticibacterium TaxID=2484746 RepID=A0A4Q6XKW5_9SPHI|nr:AraC family transcriptional regulator [Sphingobacterium corticibacterium]RZF57962.1 AraC family transcriptional regulator [Sphingobacterium corticibacterium]
MNKLVTSALFKREYLKNIPESFQWQETPLQIYSLSFLRNHLNLPLPYLRNDYNFLFYIREGSFVNQIGNEVYRVEADSLIFISIGTVSALQEISPDLNGYFILIENEAMSLLFNQQELLNVFMIDPVLHLKLSESNWIDALCRLIFTELISLTSNSQTGNSLVQALLNKILYLSKKNRSVSRTQQMAIKFKQSVHQNYINEKQVSFYANELAVSANYLNRCVKTVFGKSCKEIILEVAMLNSQILLADINKSISEISYELNFDDPSYFTRIFKSFTGRTPSRYRSEAMHDLS